ncbi:PEP/pyruvate-binding domain-containing protein [Pseudomonas sp. 58(2021)]|uniref:PEP/pyruvate-binding domain-containing protein n=1 Tax=Pseudomonas sp. 58(2021) TaxID=2813330 RepID=UPI001A9FDA20|nr:PEP/pyruvate-binding domain-containing protein [Pseudomonas sp. 58(2021)]
MQSMTLVSPFEFSGKAGTLESLAPFLQNGRVLPLHRFTVGNWRNKPQAILDYCVGRFGDQPLIVRSSSLTEDQDGTSGAGMYDSVGNVCGAPALQQAIEQVIASYGQARDFDEVLIQSMATGVLASGVAMTRDPESGLPYYVVDYVPGHGTDGVTAGTGTVHSFVAIKSQTAAEPAALKGLFALLAEVEQLTERDALDIEFAITEDGPLLFQVRPMTGQGIDNIDARADIGLQAVLDSEVVLLEGLARKTRQPELGVHAFLGLMPDWNPAEMIGVKPRPLAYSLYKELITDVNWASARFRYGYRDMRNKPLMYQFSGSPYICIPYSVESFIPASLPLSIVNSVVTQCCEHLGAHQSLHDKIEFSIIPTCFTPQLAAMPAESIPAFKGLNAGQRALYLAELKSVTEHIISADGPFFSDLTRLPRIEQKVERLDRDPENVDPLHRLRHALADAKVVGEVFSGVARAAFVATAVIKSLENQQRIPAGFTDWMIGGVHTVGRKMADDFRILHKEAFLRLHGHVRPGTYDVRVARYDESPQAYFDWSTPPQRAQRDEGPRVISGEIRLAVQQAFDECRFRVSAEQFFKFLDAAVAAREKVKYLYGAFVSQALKALAGWGREHELSLDELSFARLGDFVGNLEEVRLDSIRDKIASNRTRWQQTQNIRTPVIVCKPQDLLAHAIESCNPNFITRSSTQAPVAVLRAEDIGKRDIEGCIVLIENADPGFDWIFTHRIAGFITAYGGENSHMSIRAREFAIPAAIGVGDVKFRSLLNSKRLILDCAERRIQVLS